MVGIDGRHEGDDDDAVLLVFSSSGRSASPIAETASDPFGPFEGLSAWWGGEPLMELGCDICLE